MSITPAERALLAQPTWTADQLIRIAFIARRLLAELDARSERQASP